MVNEPQLSARLRFGSTSFQRLSTPSASESLGASTDASISTDSSVDFGQAGPAFRGNRGFRSRFDGIRPDGWLNGTGLRFPMNFGLGNLFQQLQQLLGQISRRPPLPQPTPTPVSPTPTPNPGSDLTTVDYRKLTKPERQDISSFSDRERAIFHLWGRQMSTVGQQNGAIYNSVLDAVKNGKAADGSEFTPAERQLVQELAAKEKQQFGGFTGRLLDEEFFKIFGKITGQDISQRFANRPTHFAGEQRALFPQGKGDVDSDSWINAIAQQSGLNSMESSILRFWGHDPLISEGKITGKILPMTLLNSNALDKGQGNQANAKALLEADMADDGVNNGSSIATGFSSMLDKLYFGGPGLTTDQVKNQAVQTGLRKGRSMAQIQKDMTTGVQNALSDFKDFAKKHPIMLAGSAAGMMTAMAVCPFCAGLAGAAAAGGMMSGSLKQASN
ncbi:MAG: hypothetical protein K2X66_16660 [Cyanobacteria bacterium]|nr:hypothetical protein [Cyanobacteriota bacterium]